MKINGVYFISYEDMNYIKIGVSFDIYKRLIYMQMGCPVLLSLIGYIKVNTGSNARKIERSFHEKFNKNRMHGEWFYNIDINDIKKSKSFIIDNEINNRLKNIYTCNNDQFKGRL